MTDSSSRTPSAVPSGPGWVSAPPHTAAALVRPRPLIASISAPLARRAIAAAAGFGLLFEALVVGEVAGINVAVWTGALLVTAAVVGRPWQRLARCDAWLPIAALVFAVFAALRAAPALQAFDVLAAIALTGASLAAMAGIGVTTRSIGGVLRLGGRGVLIAGSSATHLGDGLRGWQPSAGVMAPTLRRVVVGIILALAPLTVFAILFAQADALFGSLLVRLFDWRLDTGDLITRGLLGAATAWAVGGLLAMVLAATPRLRRDRPVALPRLAGLEATVMLVAVDLLFGVFVAIQAGYLFGGLDTVSETGLGYAEYARRGFFELVAVALLAGLLLVLLESAVLERGRNYRVAAIALVGLTGVVLSSAAYRMGLYQAAFGWTELRFYVAAAIGWLALCLLAAGAAVIRDRSRWLPHTATVLALGVAVVVNLADPQSFVAGQNVRRALSPSAVPVGGTTGLDAEYLDHLGADAVPVLLEALPRLDDADRTAVRNTLVRLRRDLGALDRRTGWPSWQLARSSALEQLEKADLR